VSTTQTTTEEIDSTDGALPPLGIVETTVSSKEGGDEVEEEGLPLAGDETSQISSQDIKEEERSNLGRAVGNAIPIVIPSEGNRANSAIPILIQGQSGQDEDHTEGASGGLVGQAIPIVIPSGQSSPDLTEGASEGLVGQAIPIVISSGQTSSEGEVVTKVGSGRGSAIPIVISRSSELPIVQAQPDEATEFPEGHQPIVLSVVSS